jgi:hypothetical protein
MPAPNYPAHFFAAHQLDAIEVEADTQRATLAGDGECAWPNVDAYP